MTTAEIDQARACVEILNNVLGITRVVLVDDVLSQSDATQDIVGAIAAMIADDSSESALAKFPELNGIEFDDEQGWRDDVAEFIGEMSDAQRKNFAIRVADISDDGQDDEEANAGDVLGSILPGNELLVLSLSQWQATKDELLQQSDETLFLFDQVMTSNGGSSTQGMEIISGLLADPSLNVRCGLLSHTIQCDAEHEALSQLVKEFGITDENRLAVISKKHLNTAPISFAKRLKRIAIAPACARLTEAIGEILRETAEIATERLSKLSVYDFEQIVFESSLNEGVWEPDTLIRIYSLFQANEVRTRAFNDARISKATKQIRGTVHIGSRPVDAPIPTSRQIKKMEWFEGGDYLNSHYMPLDLGDLFETDRGKKMMVICQPCDLMVRSDGKRGGLENVILANVLEEKPKELSAEKLAADPGLYNAYFQIPSLGGTEENAWVQLKRAIHVPINVLDLASLGSTGEVLGKSNWEMPQGLIPSWEKRFHILHKYVSRLLNKFDEFLKKQPNGEQRQVFWKGLISTDQSFLVPTVDHDVLRFGLKRVGRLRKPFSEAMLSKYCRYVSRHAYEHDLTSSMRRGGT